MEAEELKIGAKQRLLNEVVETVSLTSTCKYYIFTVFVTYEHVSVTI